MRRLLPYLLIFLTLPLFGRAQIPETLLRSCPTVFQVNSERILCTSGTAAEPDRDTGIVQSLHRFVTNPNRPTISLGNSSLTDSMCSASITYFYRVDTNNKRLFCTQFGGQIVFPTNASGSKPEFSIRILDSNGASIDTNCFEAIYSGNDSTLWSQYSSSDSLTRLFLSDQICFDLRPLHGQTIRICFNSTCPSPFPSSCTASFTLDCYNLTNIYSSDPCGPTISYYAPPGFRYRWTLASDPYTTLGTESFLNDPNNQYFSQLRCQLSFKSPTSQNTCLVDNLYYTPTPRYVIGINNPLRADFFWDTIGHITSGTCTAQLRLRDSATIRVIDSSGSYSIHDSSIFISQYRLIGLCDTLTLPSSTTLFNLTPGGYMLYRDIITPTCTFTYSNSFAVHPFPCEHYDSLIRTCPDEIDTCSIRYLCTADNIHGALPSYDSTGHLIGHFSLNYSLPHTLYPWDHIYYRTTRNHHHYPIHNPSLDSITQNQLTTTPPDFSTSFFIGNETSENPAEEFQNLYFQYHVDTNQHTILMVRYALVMQYLIEEPSDLYSWGWCGSCYTHDDTIQTITQQHTNHPRFLFHFLDSAWHEIRPDLYNIDITLDTIPDWNNGVDSSIFWKNWSSFGIGLHALHGRTITIHFATETSNLLYSRAIYYAYIHFQCIEGSIRATHCRDTNHYIAPDGFTYQWFRDENPDSIICTSQQFVTISDSTYYCRLTDLNDSSIHILLPTILAPPQYPVARFSLDTLELLNDCSLLLHINDSSYIATEHNPDSITTTPCHNTRYWIDDTLTNQLDTTSHHLKNIFTVSPGQHTLTFVATINGTSCTDTIVYTFYVPGSCHCYDTIYDTIIQNQLPYSWHSINFTDTSFFDSVGASSLSIDTSLRVPGIRPQCDSLIDYHLRLYLNTSDSATLVLCPDSIPYAINDTLYISADTTIVFHGAHGEDSIINYHLIRLTNSDTVIYDTITEDQLPWFALDTVLNDTMADYIYHTRNKAGCDSTIHYNLFVIFFPIGDTILYYACESELPVQYGDSLFYQEGEGTFHFTGSHGQDSLITFILHIVPSSDTTIRDSITESQLPWFAFDTLFSDTVADYIYHLYNEAGCDSIIHYHLYIFWNGDHCDTTLEFPNFVTPNGDGHNDRFVIKGLIENNCFKYNELTIYDRYGHQVYHRCNIATDDDWWDPAARRHPGGTYFYYFKAHGVTIHTQHTGVIEVLRDK